MHRLFLILMIALLPLRGWVGDVMAVEMTSKTLVATEYVANYNYQTLATGHSSNEKAAQTHAECPGHAGLPVGPATDLIGAAVPAEAAENANDAANEHCNTCGTCQICHSVALASSPAWMPPSFTPLALPSGSSIQFASALTALSQKPPIS
jgi:hypothetical protein